jgi:hypothetical protein
VKSAIYKWVFVLLFALPFVVYLLNKDINALITGEIHGRGSSIYYRGVHDMFWLYFAKNLLYAFAFCYLAVLLFDDKSNKQSEEDKIDSEK